MAPLELPGLGCPGTADGRGCSICSSWPGGKREGDKEKTRSPVRFSLPAVDKGAGFCLQETMFPMAGPAEIVKQRQTLLRTAAAAALSFSTFLSSQSIDPLAQL